MARTHDDRRGVATDMRETERRSVRVGGVLGGVIVAFILLVVVGLVILFAL